MDTLINITDNLIIASYWATALWLGYAIAWQFMKHDAAELDQMRKTIKDLYEGNKIEEDVPIFTPITNSVLTDPWTLPLDIIEEVITQEQQQQNKIPLITITHQLCLPAAKEIVMEAKEATTATPKRRGRPPGRKNQPTPKSSSVVRTNRKR